MRTPFLTTRDLQLITERIRLRAPGSWLIYVYDDEFLGPYLRLVGRIPDNTCGTRTIDIGIDSRIPPCRTVADYLNWFLHRWIEVWIHEAREQFTYNGKLWSDPHAEVTEAQRTMGRM